MLRPTFRFKVQIWSSIFIWAPYHVFELMDGGYSFNNLGECYSWNQKISQIVEVLNSLGYQSWQHHSRVNLHLIQKWNDLKHWKSLIMEHTHAVDDNHQSPNTIWPIIFTSPVTYLRAIEISKIDIGRSRSHEPINHIRKRPLPVSFEEQVVESLHKVEFRIQFALPSLHQNTTSIILIMHISKWSMQSSAKFEEEQTSPTLWQCTNAQQNKGGKVLPQEQGWSPWQYTHHQQC